MTAMVDVWTRELDRARAVALSEWETLGHFGIAEMQDDGIDLAAVNRVYADYFAPRTSAPAMSERLQSLGWEILFFPAEPYDAAFIHTRQERVWSVDELRMLAPTLYTLCCEFDAGFDGWFIVSAADDDE